MQTYLLFFKLGCNTEKPGTLLQITDQEFNGGDDIFQLDAGIEDPFRMFFVQIKVQFDKGLCSETGVTEQDGIFGHTQFKGILKV